MKGLFLLKNNHIEPLRTKIDRHFKEKRLTGVAVLANRDIAISTVEGGLYVIDQSGNYLRHIDKESGLIGKTSGKMFADMINNAGKNAGGRGLARNRRDVAGGDQLCLQRLPVRFRHEHVRKSRIDRIGRVHARAGHAKILARPPRSA